MKPRIPSHVAAAASVEVVSDGAPKRRIQLLPIGKIEMRDGRGPFLLADRAAAEAVVSASRARARATDILVDYDHQSLYGAGEGVGGRAPAAGWISPASLSAEDDGIWADVDWTPAAEEQLGRREYRYISPLFSYEPASGRVLAILNAGLTNTPAIRELAAVASTQTETRMDLRDLSKIAAALALAATATEDEIVLAIGKMTDGIAAAAAKLNLPKTASLDEVIVAASTVDPTHYVAASVVTDLTKRLATLEAEKGEAIVAAAMKAGKIVPAQKDFWVGRMKADPVETAAYLEAAPAILEPGELIAAAAVKPGSDGLTADERAAAAAIGVSAEAYAKAKGA